MVNELILAGLFEQLFGARRRAIEAVRAHGALSPATAKSLADLQLSDDHTWARLVAEGRVREGPTGRFYLFDPPRASARERAVKLIVFYALIVLIPIVMFALSSRGR